MIKVLDEALPLSLAKQYVKISKGRYKNLYPEIFPEGVDRIFLPTKIKFSAEDSPIYTDIESVLNQRNFRITDYIGGYAKSTINTKESPRKIGKLLTEFMKIEKDYGYGNDVNYSFNSNNIDDLKSLWHGFEIDPVRNIKQEDLAIVISRHPYDLAGMSTDRAWESCMSIHQKHSIVYGKNIEQGGRFGHGNLHKDIQIGIKEGDLIAYLINKNEPGVKNSVKEPETHSVHPKDPIIRPIARLSIKALKSPCKKNTYLLVSDALYYQGKNDNDNTFENTIMPTMHDEVQRFINAKHNTKKAPLGNGKYYAIHPKAYTDDASEIGQEKYREYRSYSIENPKGKFSVMKDFQTNEVGIVWNRWNTELDDYEGWDGDKDYVVVPFSEQTIYGFDSFDDDKLITVTYDRFENGYKTSSSTIGLMEIVPEVKVLLKTSYKFIERVADKNYKNIGNLMIVIRSDNKAGVYNVKTQQFVIPLQYNNIEFKEFNTKRYFIATIYGSTGKNGIKTRNKNICFDMRGKIIPNPARAEVPVTKKKKARRK